MDGGGVAGYSLHYAMIMAFTGGAGLLFFYLWRRGRLDMDEEPKYTMLYEEEAANHSQEDRHG